MAIAAVDFTNSAIVGTTLAASPSPTTSSSSPQGIPNPEDVRRQVDAINEKIRQNYPPELLEEGRTSTPSGNNTSQAPLKNLEGIAAGQNPGGVVPSGGNNLSSGSEANLGIPTPAIVAFLIIFGALVFFPIFQLIIHAKQKEIDVQKAWIFQKFFKRWEKPTVSETDAYRHKRDFDRALELSKKANDMHIEKFSSGEFLEFFKLQSGIKRGVSEAVKIAEIADLLNAAIVTQKSFTIVEQAESKYCSGKQQELYHFVAELLAKQVSCDEFKQSVSARHEEISPQLKTEEGKIALANYTREICKVAEHKLGLKLLTIFKKHNFTEFAIVRAISEKLEDMKPEELIDPDSLTVSILAKGEMYEKLAVILGIDVDGEFAKMYCKVFQYIGLSKRHMESFAKFQELIEIVKKLKPLLKSIQEIRSNYDSKTYQLSKEFMAELPGLDLYKKYKSYLENDDREETSAASSSVKMPIAS